MEDFKGASQFKIRRVDYADLKSIRRHTKSTKTFRPMLFVDKMPWRQVILKRRGGAGPSFTSSSTIMQQFLKKDNSCDGWRDKLVGKTILKNDEETALSTEQVINSGIYFVKRAQRQRLGCPRKRAPGGSPSYSTGPYDDNGFPSRKAKHTRG